MSDVLLLNFIYKDFSARVSGKKDKGPQAGKPRSTFENLAMVMLEGGVTGMKTLQRPCICGLTTVDKMKRYVEIVA